MASVRALELVGDPEIAARMVPLARLTEGRGHRSTGVAALDALLGGGWPRGALTELCGPRSSGRTAIVRAALSAALAAGEAVALVDAGGTLDARALPSGGAPLWIRCQAGQALKAADLVIAAGGFGLVAIDLCDALTELGFAQRSRRGRFQEPSQGSCLNNGSLRVPDAAWMRLRHAARAQGTTVLISVARPRLGAFAAASVELTGAPAFQPRPLFSGVDVRAQCRRAAHDAPPSPEQPRPSCVSLAFTCRS